VGGPWVPATTTGKHVLSNANSQQCNVPSNPLPEFSADPLVNPDETPSQSGTLDLLTIQVYSETSRLIAMSPIQTKHHFIVPVCIRASGDLMAVIESQSGGGPSFMVSLRVR
jgi:hypothetical protein